MPSQNDAIYDQVWSDHESAFRLACFSIATQRWEAIKACTTGMRFKRIIDLGCGNGCLLWWLQKVGFCESGVGVDANQMGIDVANKTFISPGLEYKCISPQSPLTDLGKFDLAMSSHVLEHIGDPRQAVCAMSMLAPFQLHEVPLEKCMSLSALDVLGVRKYSNHIAGHVQFWNKRSFVEMAESAGLSILRHHQYEATTSHLHTGSARSLAKRALLRLVGMDVYSKVFYTHYIVMARSGVSHA